MQVGVLGATGRVAKGVLKVLDRKGVQVMAFYRNPEKASEMLREFQSERIRFVRLDLEDSEALEKACGECELLINCAGPASEIMDRIAVCCLKKAKRYVDVAGGKALKQKIEQSGALGNGGICVLGAGIYPGLTEVFSSAVARRHPSIKELKTYFYGNSPLSETAAYDIVAGMEGASGGMSYVNDGVVKKISGTGTKEGRKPSPFDRLVTMPVLGDEFFEMACREKIPEAYFYHSFPNDKALMDFAMIKVMQKYKTRDQKLESAKLIQRMFFRPDEKCEVALLAEYSCNGESDRSGWLRLWSDEDWSMITGYVAGLAAMELMETEKKVQGVFYLAEVADTEKMLDQLGEFCRIVMEQGPAR